MREKITVTGTITNYIYTSNESMYKVCRIVTLDEDDLVIVGSFPRLEEGLVYEFTGVMTDHPKYGNQLVVSSYAKSNSFTKEGLINYLSSDKFPGIGPKLASSVVTTLGVNCLGAILDDPSYLDKVIGLSDKKKQIIVESLKANFNEEQVFVRLYGFGLTDKMIYKLYEKYNDKAANVIEENPYQLIYDIEGIGFKKADSLALNLGFKVNDLIRIKAAIIYTLNVVCYQQGFTFLTKEQLLNSTKNLLQNNKEISEDDYRLALVALMNDNEIKYEDDRFYEKNLYYSEVSLAKKINDLAKTKITNYKKNELLQKLELVSRDLNMSYTDMQKEAIINSLSNKLSIITGGPGTGKSTILNAIIRLYAYMNDLAFPCDELSYKITLVAPTGRAAKRMTETTNMKAQTIHKTLGYNFDGGFSFDEYNLLPVSLLIVDESSMLDVNIAASLFKAIPNSCRVILVGDANQLPSISPGNVLTDLMKTSKFKTTSLTQIMRQNEGSNIIKLSNMVLNERIAYNIFSSKSEVFYYDCDAQGLIDMIYKILDKYISSGGDIQNKLQILAPMYAGVAGIDAINTLVSERYNKQDDFIIRDEKKFKIKDKVLQLRNDPELQIMNGDIGQILSITKIDEKDALLIDFDGKVVTYYAKNLEDLRLAYAISIHKSQGSEYDYVILPILPSYSIMLRKKLIYTAITRAKKKVIILGKLDALEKAIHNPDPIRQTSLYQRIEDVQENSNLINDSNIPFATLGEYDMDDITPYSFM